MEYPIGEEENGLLLKSYLLRRLRLSNAILIELKKRPDGILVNGNHVTVRYILRAGDILSLALDDGEGNEEIEPVCLPLHILYEDSDVIAVNKPPFMPTHPSHGHHDDTLANALAYEFKKRGEPFVFRPGGRLDRDTSGAVVCAKNKTAAYRFYEAHRSGTFGKEYIAVLDGHLEPAAGVIDAPIARTEASVIMRCVSETEGAAARTEYRVLAYGEAPGNRALTLVSASPVTGRTHQLRVHFAAAGAPILGDFLYGTEGCGDALSAERTQNVRETEIPAETEEKLISRQALHAARLSFPHPSGSGRMTVCAALPPDMRALLRFFPDAVRELENLSDTWEIT